MSRFKHFHVGKILRLSLMFILKTKSCGAFWCNSELRISSHRHSSSDNLFIPLWSLPLHIKIKPFLKSQILLDADTSFRFLLLGNPFHRGNMKILFYLLILVLIAFLFIRIIAYLRLKKIAFVSINLRSITFG